MIIQDLVRLSANHPAAFAGLAVLAIAAEAIILARALDLVSFILLGREEEEADDEKPHTAQE